MMSDLKPEEMILHENPEVRAAAARRGAGLSILVNDKDWMVRMEVAEAGYGLERLISDENPVVRMKVAEKAYGLRHLINDESPMVRKAVARNRYGLNKLANDESSEVREEVALQQHKVDKLSNDESWIVRAALAHQGLALDKLVNDESEIVRGIAQKLTDAKVFTIAKNFGVYNYNVYLYVWKDKYEIKTGSYETDSLDWWKEKYGESIDPDLLNEYFLKMEEEIDKCKDMWEYLK